ncbi:hypothetical protein [Xiamenia xianingshaonis]|uniref:Uncharacterized protein n=1 Tax=Xiamenia xianingshaonis TaxID=2682776 RepID=A0ABX0IFV0_9ACTN|nr:hypothetical protein [Xiamenia xianingshaonis]NHM13490.1 hypothetical protein [Xiamenia xianingshaonis]
MKRKPFAHRTLATMLAATMLCSLTPAAAFGVGEDVPPAVSDAAETAGGPVAQVGGKSYNTLLEAISAASEGDTITLLWDFKVPDSGDDYPSYNLPKNSTLDLGEKILTVPFHSAIFQGENATIKNGKINSSADYSIWIGNGDEDIDTSITLQNVKANAGINVLAASATLKNCEFDASGKGFYAIWADTGNAEITVESGTYTGGKEAAVNADAGVYEGGAAPGKIFIKGGDFTGKIRVESGSTPAEEDGFSNGEVYISGGTFDTNVEEGCLINNDCNTWHFLTGCATQAESDGKYVVSAEHVWTGKSTVTSYPTCTSSGKERVQCKYCTTTRDFIIPATGHSFGTWETDVEPTCTEDGSQTRACSRCGEAQTEAVPALGHAWADEPTVDVPPTCTDDGSESIHCSRCGETKDATALPALGHDFGEGVVTAEPTATQDGVLTFTCSRCPATKTEPIPATGPAPHEHSFAGAPWERDAHVHWRTCTVEGCGAASAKEPHAFGGWTVTKDPTTTEAGAQARACGVCGFTQTETLPVLEPDANGWVETDDGTWQLVGEGGKPVEEGWQEVGGEWYYFSESAMQTGWEQVGDTWYYLEDSGAMATGWQQVDGEWYYLNGAGEGVEGSMATGWKEVEGDWYYLEKSGAMATGWQQVGGTWYYLAEKGEGTEGSMVTGWKLVDGSWFRFEGSGAMLSGWQKVGGAWYLLNATHDGTFGRMLEGWRQVSGSTGKPTSANSWYYLNPGSGAMAASTRVGGYYVDASGRWRPGR